MLGCALREGRGDSRVVGSCWTSLVDLGTVVWVWHRSSPFPFCPVRAKNRSKSFLGIVFLRENPMILGLLSIFCSNPRMGGGESKALAAALWCGLGALGILGMGLNVLGTSSALPASDVGRPSSRGKIKIKRGLGLEFCTTLTFATHNLVQEYFLSHCL